MKLNIKSLRYISRVKNNFFIHKAVSYINELYAKTSATNEKLQIQFFEYLPFIVSSILTGIMAYLYSQIFFLSEQLSHTIYAKNHLYVFFITPLSFLLSWWLVRRFAPYSKGSGIPQVMAAIQLAKPQTNFLIESFLGLKIIVVKIVSSAIKIFGGGILGREGPTIQISSSIFYLVYKNLPYKASSIPQQNILIAGAASGLAAAFNTPLGGIIFAIEELSKNHINYYKSPLFIAVIIAGLAAQGLGGSYLYLGYPATNFTGWYVLVGVLLTSIIAGYFGSKMCEVLLKFIKFFGSFKSYFQQILLVLVCGMIVATSIYFFGTESSGSGKEIMERVLFSNDKNVEWYLPFLRMFGLIFSFGYGGAGGVFAPSLSTGASIGSYIASFLDLTNDNANLLILIGMASFLTGVTRAPFTSSIIIFEMTDRHSIIFFLMLAAIISSIVSNLVNKQSFYDQLKSIYISELKTDNHHP